jgi:hypothetical protein
MFIRHAFQGVAQLRPSAGLVNASVLQRTDRHQTRSPLFAGVVSSAPFQMKHRALK